MTRKISPKALKKAFHNWYYGNMTCITTAHMETFGFLSAMLPIVEDLYDTKEEQEQALATYTDFFNTEPQLGAVIIGITANLEEARANGATYITKEVINSIRMGLMGPIGGIGDSMIVSTLIPVLIGISMELSTDGSPIGCIFYIIIWNLFAYFGMRFLFYKGYKSGKESIEFLSKKEGKALRSAFNLFGTVVIGSLTAAWIHIQTSFSLASQSGEIFLVLQDKLDQVYPGLLTGGCVVLCWFLMKYKKLTSFQLILLLLVLAFIGIITGFFDPTTL
ncbi:MAG: PTS system mannose/fructose/sorbose family transporter subunit IID [Bacillota bacterium]|nr:PTS system mannose/fructose/sorbose family transporter subunit IID [Bacillota bacterium]